MYTGGGAREFMSIIDGARAVIGGAGGAVVTTTGAVIVVVVSFVVVESLPLTFISDAPREEEVLLRELRVVGDDGEEGDVDMHKERTELRTSLSRARQSQYIIHGRFVFLPPDYHS